MSNPLKDLLPAKVRQSLYVLVTVAGLAYAALEAVGGDWQKAIPIFLASLVPLLAAGNITTPPAPPGGLDGYSHAQLVQELEARASALAELSETNTGENDG